MAHVPTVALKHLTPDQKRAYVLADNRMAELSAWDDVVFKEELEVLACPEITFDFEVRGFDTPDLDRLADRASAKLLLGLAQKHVPTHPTIAALMEEREPFEFTEQDRRCAEHILDGIPVRSDEVLEPGDDLFVDKPEGKRKG
jgi:hypothetical protein